MTDLEALVTLNLLPGIGPVKLRKLLLHFNHQAQAALNAPVNELLKVSGIGADLANVIHSWQNYNDAAAEIADVHSRGIEIVHYQDARYPKPLHDIYDAPLLIYVWGELLPRDEHAIGIVGSRRTTSYGQKATKQFAFQCAQAGYTILSGLARGIDTVAHESAIAAQGRTIAIIGSGLGQLYPPENMALAEKIASGYGAVISEFPLHRPPDKQTFPLRNRLVAGWGKALLVTECPAWSGSLITANLANDYGKSVFAIPGPIDKPSSAGCNQLIRDGATLVTIPEHLLDELGMLPFAQKNTSAALSTASSAPALPEEEQIIYEVLQDQEMSMDQIIERVKLPTQHITAILMKLEMRKLIRALPGFRFQKR